MSFWFVFGFFLLATIAIAIYQANFYNAHMADGKTLNHPLWFLFYCIPVIIEYLVWKNLGLVLLAFLIRGVVFSPLLNYLRKPRKAFFYIHGTGGKGSSFLDGLLMKINKAYPYVWGMELAGLIALFIIRNKLG